MTLLLRTEVGSHMWRMNRPDSDHDYFKVYLGSTRHILLGGFFRSIQKRDELGKLDQSCHELGVTVEKLIKGNINFIIGVNSPLCQFVHPDIALFRESPAPYLTKEIGDSLFGMVHNNIGKYGRKEPDDSPRWSKLMRILKLGEALAASCELRFEPVGVVWYDHLLEELRRIRSLFYSSTILPDAPPSGVQEVMRDLVVDLRVKQLCVEEISRGRDSSTDRL